jgi:hypothetical protein
LRRRASGGSSALNLPWGVRLGDFPTTGAHANLNSVYDDGPSFYSWDAGTKEIVLLEPGQYLQIVSVEYDEGGGGATPANSSLSLNENVSASGFASSWNPQFPLIENSYRSASVDGFGHKTWNVYRVDFIGFDSRFTEVRLSFVGGFSSGATPTGTIEWGIAKISTESATFPP